MSGDIVERLRLLAATYPLWGEVKTRSNEAADEIVRLRAAGDALAAIVGDVVVPYDDESKARTMVAAYDAWREARRG